MEIEEPRQDRSTGKIDAFRSLWNGKACSYRRDSVSLNKNHCIADNLPRDDIHQPATHNGGGLRSRGKVRSKE